MVLRLALVVLLLLLGDAPAGAAEAIGKVVKQGGTALVLRATRPLPLAVGLDLLAEDEVRTGTDGRVVIESPDGVRLVIGPASEVRLKLWLADRKKNRLEVVLSLVSGVVRLLGEEASGARSIAVETRAAVAAVRSTEWLVQATGVGTGVLAIAGAVEVRAGDALVTLVDGQGTDVTLGGRPTAPATWSPERQRRLLDLVPY